MEGNDELTGELSKSTEPERKPKRIENCKLVSFDEYMVETEAQFMKIEEDKSQNLQEVTNSTNMDKSRHSILFFIDFY